MIKRNKIQVYKAWILPLVLIICGGFLLITVVFAFMSGKPNNLISNGLNQVIPKSSPIIPSNNPNISNNPQSISFKSYRDDNSIVDHGIPEGYNDKSDPGRSYNLYTREVDGKKYWIKIEVRLNSEKLSTEAFTKQYLENSRAREILFQDQYLFRDFVADRVIYKNYDKTIGINQFFVGVPRSYQRNILSKEFHVITFGESISTDIEDKEFVDSMRTVQKENEINQFFDNYIIEHSRYINN